MSTTGSERMVLSPGGVVDGKYVIERVLGEGAMGVVLAARHTQLDEPVAIKFMRPELAARGGELVARFLREGKAAAKIRSEHVARVRDVDVTETGAPYLVMEYLEGKDLSRLIEEGTLGVDEALDYVLQAMEAIAEAHFLGIVHRDLKPANLFLTRRADGSPCVKVLDFGISKMQGAMEDPALTNASVIVGSPLYMSPEQLVSSKAVDARTDIWALGVVLYELLVGAPPFNAETSPQLVAQVMHGAPNQPLRACRPDVPPEVEAAVLRCLEKDAGARFATVAELAAALAPSAPASAQVSIERIARISGGYVASEASASFTRARASGRLEPAASASAPLGGSLGAATLREASDARQRQRRRTTSVIVVLAAASAIGIAALVVRRSGSDASSASGMASPTPVIASVGVAPLAPPVTSGIATEQEAGLGAPMPPATGQVTTSPAAASAAPPVHVPRGAMTKRPDKPGAPPTVPDDRL